MVRGQLISIRMLKLGDHHVASCVTLSRGAGSRHNQQIGFPIQFALAEETVTMEYPVTDPPKSPDTQYQVEWTDWNT